MCIFKQLTSHLDAFEGPTLGGRIGDGEVDRNMSKLPRHFGDITRLHRINAVLDSICVRRLIVG
jgi:hypothetical protein